MGQKGSEAMTAEEALKVIFESNPGSDELAELIKVIAKEYKVDITVIEKAIEHCRNSISLEAFVNCVKSTLKPKLKRKYKP